MTNAQNRFLVSLGQRGFSLNTISTCMNKVGAPCGLTTISKYLKLAGVSVKDWRNGDNVWASTVIHRLEVPVIRNISNIQSRQRGRSMRPSRSRVTLLLNFPQRRLHEYLSATGTRR
jgi:hypothetical protein